MQAYINDYKTYIKKNNPPWGAARKVTLDGGFTCPNIDGTVARGGCIYCNNAAFSPAVRFRQLTITEQLNKNIPFLKTRYHCDKFIAYFQPFTNTYAPVEVLKKKYDEALIHPDVMGIAIGTRPDCLSDEVIELLGKMSEKTQVFLEIGLQTAHDDTLKLINRHHTFEQFAKTMAKLEGLSLEIGLHMILGLPGENPKHFVQTAQALLPFSYQAMKVHPIYVVRGTRLEKIYQQGEYHPMEKEEYLEALADFLELIPFKILIQRLHGSAPKKYFIGPEWCRDAQDLSQSLYNVFERRGSRQGTKVDSI